MKENDKYILAPYVAVGFKNNILNLGYGNLNTEIHNEEIQKAILEICKYFKEPQPLSKIFELGLVDSVAQECYRIITSKPYLISEKYKSEKSTNRFVLNLLSRGKDLEKFLEKISKFTINIIGCGAIGTSVAMLLASYGFKNFNLFDCECFDETNIMRCSYLKQDVVNLNKSNALKDMLLKKNKSCIVNAYNTKLTKDNIDLLPECDLIILSGDSSYLLTLVNEFSVKRKYPFISIGYAQGLAVIGPFVIPGKTSCVNCRRMNLKNRLKQNPSNIDTIHIINSNYISPASPGLVSLSASIGVNEIIKFVLEEDSIAENRQFVLSDTSYTCDYMDYEISPDCYCQK